MRIEFIVVVGMLLVLALWRGVNAQEAATGRCWDVEHGPIGSTTYGNSANRPSPEMWEAVLVNECTGETWRRSDFGDQWVPIGP